MSVEVKAIMSNTETPKIENTDAACCLRMESVDRIGKLPVVESTIETANNIYGKIKDYNSVTQWTLQTAENTVYKAVELTKPVCAPLAKNLEGPIKKVDGVLCTGLDYVEEKVPCVKQPPSEIINSTKEFVNQKLDTAAAYVKPAVETAHSYVDPMVQPALEKAQEIKELSVQKVHEYIHQHLDHGPTVNNSECKACQSEKKAAEEPEEDNY